MITKGMFTSNSNEWATPKALFDELNKEFNFTLDPCATPENAKCKKFYTEQENGLLQDWSNEVVFCNPPYGRAIKEWVEKCYNENKKGATVVMLIPAQPTQVIFINTYTNNTRLDLLRGGCILMKVNKAHHFRV